MEEGNKTLHSIMWSGAALVALYMTLTLHGFSKLVATAEEALPFQLATVAMVALALFSTYKARQIANEAKAVKRKNREENARDRARKSAEKASSKFESDGDFDVDAAFERYLSQRKEAPPVEPQKLAPARPAFGKKQSA